MTVFFKPRLLSKLLQMAATELRNFAAELLHENSHLAATLDAIPSAVFVIDRERQTIRFVNRFARKWLQHQERYYGRPLLKTIAARELSDCLRSLLMNKDAAHQYQELQVFARQPKTFLVGASAFSPSTPTKPATLITITDITTLKAQFLAESERQSINSLTLLTSGIAHEIKNPLSALDIHLQLISRTLAQNASVNKSELEELFSIVNHEVKRLDEIINDFLQTFRPRKAIRKPQALNAIVTFTLKLLKANLAEKGITLKLKLAPKLPTFAFDKNLMEQLLLNIIKNSIEAIDEKATTAERNITISTHNSPNTLSLTIADSGIGIPQAHLSKVFTPFYTSKKMGTGLGLSIVSRIANEHDGKLIIESTSEAGTTLTVEFDKHPYTKLLTAEPAAHSAATAAAATAYESGTQT